MHRSEQFLIARCVSRLYYSAGRSCSRCLSSVGPAQLRTGTQVDEALGVQGSPSDDRRHAEVAERRDEELKVSTDDLLGTLEKHRARNRATIVRKFPQRESIHRAHKSYQGRRNAAGEEWNAWTVGDNGDSMSMEIRDNTGRNNARTIVQEPESRSIPYRPRRPWRMTSDCIPALTKPWLEYMEVKNGSDLDRSVSSQADTMIYLLVDSVSDEIRAYEAYMTLTAVEESAAQGVIKEVALTTQGIRQNTPLQLLGSRRTGLATPLSDIDMTFSKPNEADHKQQQHLTRASRTSKKSEAVEALVGLRRSLSKSSQFGDVELVFARVPIIQTKHRATGLKVQIQALEYHESAQEYVSKYLQELPSLRPLYTILRGCLEIRGLTSVRDGGLGSYSLLIVVVNALKHANGSFAPDDLAGRLLYILHFYSDANLCDSGYSIEPLRMFDKTTGQLQEGKQSAGLPSQPTEDLDDIIRHQDLSRPYLLCLQDPANRSNDLGCKAYLIKHIQEIFRFARESILRQLKEGKNVHIRRQSYLNTLVQANYQDFEAHRSRMERNSRPKSDRSPDYSKFQVYADYQRRVSEARERKRVSLPFNQE